MSGIFTFLLGLLFYTGKFCYATLSSPISTIDPTVAVGANVTVSINVTTSIQATNVEVSLGGTLFKTVSIRPSSITIDNNADFGSSVDVTHEVITANTQVRILVAFTSIQKANDSLAIKFKDTADVDEKTFTLDVEYCSSTFFQPSAASSSTTCGYACEDQFTCNLVSENFTAQCQEDATWNITDAVCSKRRLAAPTVTSILSTSISISYNADPDAVKYLITANPRHGRTGTTLSFESSQANAILQNLEPSTLYDISVRYENAAGESSVEGLSTAAQTHPGAPTLSLSDPLTTAVVVFLNTPNYARVSQWEVQYNSTSGFITKSMTTFTPSGQYYVYWLSELEPKTTYQIRARASKISGTTDLAESEDLFSEWITFTTEPLRVAGRVDYVPGDFNANSEADKATALDLLKNEYAAGTDVEVIEVNGTTIHYFIRVDDASLPPSTNYTITNTSFSNSLINRQGVAIGNPYFKQESVGRWDLVYDNSTSTSSMGATAEKNILITPEGSSTSSYRANSLPGETPENILNDTDRVFIERTSLLNDDLDVIATLPSNTVLSMVPYFVIKDFTPDQSNHFLYSFYYYGIQSVNSERTENNHFFITTDLAVNFNTSTYTTSSADGTSVIINVPTVEKAIKYEVLDTEVLATLNEVDIDGSPTKRIQISSLTNGTTYDFSLRITVRSHSGAPTMATSADTLSVTPNTNQCASCSPNATCETNSGGEVICICDIGFEGDGTNCALPTPAPDTITETTPDPTTETTPDPTTETTSGTTTETLPDPTTEITQNPTTETSPDPTTETTQNPTTETPPDPTTETTQNPTTETPPDPTTETTQNPTTETTQDPTTETTPDPTTETTQDPTTETTPGPTTETTQDPTTETTLGTTTETTPDPTTETTPDPTTETTLDPTTETTLDPTTETTPDPTTETTPGTTTETTLGTTTEITPDPTTETTPGTTTETTSATTTETTPDPTTETTSDTTTVTTGATATMDGSTDTTTGQITTTAGTTVTTPPSTCAFVSDPTVSFAPQQSEMGDTSFKLTWTRVATAFKYRITVRCTCGDDLTASTPVADYTVTGLTPGQTYDACITAGLCINGLVEAKTECNVFPTTPSAISNVTAIITDTSVDLTWEPAAGAQTYSVLVTRQLASRALIASDVRNDNFNGTSFEVVGLGPGANYLYEVAGKSGDVSGPPFKGSFTTPPSPGTRITTTTTTSTTISSSDVTYTTQPTTSTMTSESTRPTSSDTTIVTTPETISASKTEPSPSTTEKQPASTDFPSTSFTDGTTTNSTELSSMTTGETVSTTDSTPDVTQTSTATTSPRINVAHSAPWWFTFTMVLSGLIVIVSVCVIIWYYRMRTGKHIVSGKRTRTRV